jgi:hypothetical protein
MQGLLDGFEIGCYYSGGALNLFAIFLTRIRAARTNRRSFDDLEFAQPPCLPEPARYALAPPVPMSWRGSPLLGDCFHHFTRFMFSDRRVC